MADKLILKQTIDQINKDLILSGFEPILDAQKSLSHNIALNFLIFNSSFAHEGMWNPTLLKVLEGQMQSHGLNDFEKLVYLVFNRVKKKVVFRAENS